MLILHVDTARSWGGGQSQVRATVLGQRARGHRAVLVAHPQGALLERMREGLDLIPLAPTHEIDLASAWQLSRVVRQVRPNVIHAHDPDAVATCALALSILSPSPRPAFIASHRSEQRLGHRSFTRWKYSEVNRHVANSAALADRLHGEGLPRATLVVVHEGVDVERIARMQPTSVHEAFYLPHGSPVVVNVAALVPQKGHHQLIEAAALVVREVPDARFVIIGEGDLRPALEKQIRERHLERHVFLAGFREDAAAMIKASDLLVLTPLMEGMSLALVDAMAAGKAAVATAVGGIPEVMVDGETGYLVPPRDPQATADRLVFLLERPEARARMGEAALARARQAFTVDRMVEQTLAVYDAAVAAGTAPSKDTDHPAADGRTRTHSSSRRDTGKSHSEPDLLDR